MSRQPYTPPLPRGWFLTRPAYRRYALREATTLFIVLVGLDLCAGAVALAFGVDAFAGWWGLHQHPVALVLSALTFAMVSFHAYTWLPMLLMAVPPRRAWVGLVRPDRPRPGPGHQEPARWGVFGAGGTLAALALPAVIVAFGLLPAIGIWPLEASTLETALRSLPARAAVAIAAPLLLWHGAHRIFHGMHDLQLRRGRLAWACTYGAALTASGLTWIALLVA